ncbi:Uncharacterised protein [Bordetella pertussis]|nr:Uncharacterised protein [Bordetella pertussis]CRE21681.1 Uncharacterised protein [Bordetella pertussis]
MGSPVIHSVSEPMTPWRPASRMIRKPTTTPGNASGNISSATSARRPGNSRCQARKRPIGSDSNSVASVASVATSDSATVLNRLRQYCGLVTTM